LKLTVPAFKTALGKSHPIVISLFAAIAAFCTYSCMYAFRKPFTAGTFEGIEYWGVSYKVILVISQLLGYTLSKFAGIKIIAEMKGSKRAISIIGLILTSWVALLLFAVVPHPYNIVFLFVNGIPLGMVWGLVFAYLEGRRTTEFMGSVLAVSFIFASGFVKSVGKTLMSDYGISEFWMPFATGAIFVLPMLLFVFLLEQIPDPSQQDVDLRTERKPMTGEERRDFVKTYLLGLVALVVAYVMLTVIRDFRDNFMADVWKELKVDGAAVFTQTETWISLGILLIMSLLAIFKSNHKALMVNHYIIIAGFVLAGVSTYAYVHQMISPVVWMTLNGMGLYMGYVPFNALFFERLIAAARKPANVGFLIYIADSFGYLGSIGINLYKEFGDKNITYHQFLINALYIISFLGIALMGISLIYFNRKIEKHA
jgi:hypothetical protein